MAGTMRERQADSSAAIYRSLFEASPLPILIVQLAPLRVVLANEAAARFYGYAPTELVDMPLAALLPAADQTLVQGAQQKLERHRHRDGVEVEAAVHARPLGAAQGFHAIYVSEVSEQRSSIALVRAQVRLLGTMATGSLLPAVLDALVREVHALLPAVNIAVAVAEDDGSSERHGSAPGHDTASLAIRSRVGKALGTLLVERQHDAPPLRHEQDVLDMAVQIAALAIEADRASRALIESEARMSAFMDHSFALISIKDRQGRYVIVNRRFEQSTGVPAAVARGRTDAQLFPRALAEAYSAHDDEVVSGLKGIEFEEQIRQRDGMHTYLAAKFPLLYPGGDAYGIGAILLNMTERRQGAQALESAREEERARISRELHDELGQMLTSLGMSQTLLAGNVRKRLPDAQWVAQEIDSLNASVVGMLDAVRRIATELHPEILERLGIAGAVRWQVEEFSRRSGLRCRVTCPDAAYEVSPRHSLVIFRILQEALSNVARHSGATEVSAALHRAGSHIELTIDDNGRGMPRGAGDSLGLRGMRERAAAARGSLELGRSASGGTRITLRIPPE